MSFRHVAVVLGSGSAILGAGCGHGPAPSAEAAQTATAHDGRGHHGGPRVDHGHGDGMPHRFNDAAQWATQFDAPERDAWQQPEAVIAALALPPDAVVADIGAGTGYFAVRIAKVVPLGRVVGADVEPDMVTYLDERAAGLGLKNLVGRLTPTDSAAIDDNTDLVLVVDTYHHIDNRVAYFEGVRHKLSPRGRLAIVDFRPESERGPPASHKITAAAVTDELTQAGFVLQASHDFLPDQYFLIFAPAVAAP